MRDLQKYTKKRKKTDRAFAKDFDSGYAQFKVGVMLKQAREEAGLTQEELANDGVLGVLPNTTIEPFLSCIQGEAQFVCGLGRDQRLFGSRINEAKQFDACVSDGIDEDDRNEGFKDDTVIGDARGIVKRHEQPGANNSAADGTR